MKRKLLLLMSFVATTMVFAQELPDAITNSLQMFKDNGENDAIKLSDADGQKIKEFWGVNEESKTHFTLEFWYSVGTQSGQQELMSITGMEGPKSTGIRIRTAPKNGLFIYVNRQDKPCAMMDYPGANPNTNPILPRNEWHHVAVTFNAGVFKLYVDGEPMSNFDWNDFAAGGGTVDGVIATGITRPILDTSASAYAQDQAALNPSESTGNYFVVRAPNHDLRIADIRYWNKTLSASTIKAWYGKYVTSSHPNYANLQHNWKMNEMYDLGDGKFSIPDRGKLNVTGLLNTEDPVKFPVFADDENVTIVPTGIATAKALNASFLVNEGSREITVTAEELEGTQKITIFDAQGRAIYHAYEAAHGGILTVAAPQTAGLYFVQIGEGSNALVGKIALTR